MTLYERWGVQPSKDIGVRRFANRLAVLLREDQLRFAWSLNLPLRKEYYFLMAHETSDAEELKDKFYYHNYTYSNQYTSAKDKLVSNVESQFERSKVLKNLLDVRTAFKLAQILESLLVAFSSHSAEKIPLLLGAINKTIKRSESKIFGFSVMDGVFIFRPLGSSVLDDNIVSKTMSWLDKFPESKKRAVSAFEHYSSSDPQRLRNMLDDLRLSLESLLKLKFGERNLSNQKSHIGSYLHANGYSSSSVAAFSAIFTWFDNFQNENVKHVERDFSVPESEFIMYTTFSLMYAITAMEEKAQKI